MKLVLPVGFIIKKCVLECRGKDYRFWRLLFKFQIMAALLLGIKPQIGLYTEQASAVDQETASKRDRNVLTYHILNTCVRPVSTVSLLHVLYPGLLNKRNVIYAVRSRTNTLYHVSYGCVYF